MDQRMPSFQLHLRPMEEVLGRYSWARVRAIRKVVREFHSLAPVVSSWIQFSAIMESTEGTAYSPMRSYVGLLTIAHLPRRSLRRVGRVSFLNWRDIPMPQLSRSGTLLLNQLQGPVRASQQYALGHPEDDLLMVPSAWSYQPSILQHVFGAGTLSLRWFETSGSWYSQSVSVGNLLDGCL